MSWMSNLYETYEKCSNLVGKIQYKMDRQQNIIGQYTLLPICHSTQNAQIEVVIGKDSKFIRASRVEKNNEYTIIPVTEDSSTRSSGVSPHPLCDKLKYIARDYSDYDKKKDACKFYAEYIKQLRDWCKSEYNHTFIEYIYNYLKNNDLINDLIKYGVMVVNENRKFEEKINGIDQLECFVRFRVEIPGKLESAVWLNDEVWNKYIQHYLSLKKQRDICYVTSKNEVRCDKHLAKIRNVADKTKLISSNDESGFTFRGRFNNKDQAVNVSFEVSQKAHLALRWLIDKQGYKNGDQVIVAWGIKKIEIPNLLCDTEELLSIEDGEIDTKDKYARKLNQAIRGYKSNVKELPDKVTILGLDSTTKDKGRLSITFYRQLKEDDLLERINYWHSTCIWKHNYKLIEDGEDNKGKIKYKKITFIGAPSPIDIALVAYGPHIKDNLKKATVEKILYSIVDKKNVPYELVKNAVDRASNPISLEENEKNQRPRIISVTCALIKKYRYDKLKEEWDMALDEKQMDRSYLFGRVLAIAQEIEKYALKVNGDDRETNAERLMSQYRMHPYKTIGLLNEKLRPYISRLGVKGNNLNELMAEVIAMIPHDEFCNNDKLEDTYILGYYCQLDKFNNDKKERIEAAQKINGGN